MKIIATNLYFWAKAKRPWQFLSFFAGYYTGIIYLVLALIFFP